MRPHWLLTGLLAAWPALAEDVPTGPATPPTATAGQQTVRALPTQPAAPLLRIDVHEARRMLDEKAVDERPDARAPAAQAAPVTSRTITYDVPEQKVVNPTQNFRFISLKPAPARSAPATNETGN